MSKPDSRGTPLAAPPSDRTISRSARSLTSSARRHVTRRTRSERVAPVDMVVEQRGEEVVRGGDRVEVAGEVEVDVDHRRDLRAAAAGRAALHPEARTQRRLAQREHRAATGPVQPVGEADRRRRLPLAGRSRVDRGDEDQLPRGGRAESQSRSILALYAAVGLDRLAGCRAGRRPRRSAAGRRCGRFRDRWHRAPNGRSPRFEIAMLQHAPRPRRDNAPQGSYSERGARDAVPQRGQRMPMAQCSCGGSDRDGRTPTHRSSRRATAPRASGGRDRRSASPPISPSKR